MFTKSQLVPDDVNNFSELFRRRNALGQIPIAFSALSSAMPALVAGIHVFRTADKTWMAGT